jgi:hypothetical protein
MSLKLALSLVVCLLAAGCRPTAPPEASSPPKPDQARRDEERLRRTLGNLEAHLSSLEGRIRTSSAQTWSHEASAALRDLGNIRIELGALRAGSLNVAGLQSLLSDLEGRLQGASAENWGRNASAAQHIAGNIRIELQRLSRGL